MFASIEKYLASGLSQKAFCRQENLALPTLSRSANMFPITAHFKFYLHAQATDMRKSFDGLSGVVATVLGRDPTSGDVYVFVNRRRDRLKLLVWDRTGFWLFYKRLEQGTFQLPRHAAEAAALELPYDQLVMMLEGIDLASIKKRWPIFVRRSNDLANISLSVKIYFY